MDKTLVSESAGCLRVPQPGLGGVVQPCQNIGAQPAAEGRQH